jgi:hypothetical protein
MQESYKLMISTKYMTDAEIMQAIRYLDPDSSVEGSGMALGICITFLTALTSALTYIWIYMRKL